MAASAVCCCVSDFATPWTVAHQAPLSMGFSKQEYWSGLPFPSPGDLPHPGTESESLTSAGRFFTTAPPEKPIVAENLPNVVKDENLQNEETESVTKRKN